MMLHRTLLGFVLLGTAAGCSKPASPYDRLCAIYKEYESVPSDDMMAGYEISRRVEREIPEIVPAYNVIPQNGVETRYAALVEIARQEKSTPANWECETLRKRWPPVPH
jgi:hypothetical protein